MLVIKNSGKNPNDFHDFLIQNNCAPVTLTHNTLYDEDYNVTSVATEVYVKVEKDKQSLVLQLAKEFMG